ncbi:hypothetical protein GCM10027294_25400 [Marinactinospora endophytica]
MNRRTPSPLDEAVEVCLAPPADPELAAEIRRLIKTHGPRAVAAETARQTAQEEQ